MADEVYDNTVVEEGVQDVQDVQDVQEGVQDVQEGVHDVQGAQEGVQDVQGVQEGAHGAPQDTYPPQSEYSVGPSEPAPAGDAPSSSVQLFVGGLDGMVDEQMLDDFFSPYVVVVLH